MKVGDSMPSPAAERMRLPVSAGVRAPSVPDGRVARKRKSIDSLTEDY
jgi:hypothetical protein